MMSRKLLLAALISGALATGCVQNYAQREVAQGAAPGSLLIMNAPVGAVVLIDGRTAGVATPAGVPITPGRHEVVVQANGQSIHSQAVFVAAGSRTEVRVP